MTDYTKSTNFTSKDSLATGNPLKIIKGAEFDTEFNNIVTAVATKANSLSPALTGTPLAPTAAAGTNTTQLATTAFATAAIQALYPVGSVYINASSSTNPATLFGFGIWSLFGGGRVPMGSGGAFGLGATGGSNDATVVSHAHTASAGAVDINHTHSESTAYFSSNGQGGGQDPGQKIGGMAGSTTGYMNSNNVHSHSITVDAAGISGSNANLQPFIVVNMWVRTS